MGCGIIKNFNNEARNFIIGYGKGLKLPFDIKIKLLTQRISDLQYQVDLESEILVQYLFSLLYLDAYKLYSWKQKENKLTPFQESTFCLLYNIENQNDLLDELIYNTELLKRMIIATHEVGNMDDINKIILMKSLSKEENEYLEKEWPIHNQDRKQYNIEITIPVLIELMKQKQQVSNSISFPFQYAVHFCMSGFLKNLLKYDCDNTYELFQKIAFMDYSLAQYLKVQKHENAQYKSHRDFYDDSDYEKIMHRMMTDQKFLLEGLDSLKRIYIEKEWRAIKLSEKILENQENLDMKRKLKLEVNK